MLTQSHVDALQQLADATERARAEAHRQSELIAAARREGASWASIAVILGCSKQAVARKHTPRANRRDREALLF